jgi:uncharacterized OB-fold protein
VTTSPLHGPPLPRLTPESDFFWTGGADGELRMLRCSTCDRFAHPPTPLCRGCGGGQLAPQPLSGLATVWTFTVSHQQLLPSLATPYIVAIVVLDDQDDIHLTTRLVDTAPEQVHVGMRVQVCFEQHDEIYLPLFAPLAS